MADTEITLKDIEKIADLSNLELNEEEKSQMVAQFHDILGYFKMIDAAPESEIHDHPVDNATHLRDDVSANSEVSPESFSPYLESGHFKVPKVIE